MTTNAQSITFRRRAVRLWLLACAGLIFVTVLVGGATRLTGSGLSIVEWQPVTGVLPPASEADWRLVFQKYQTIPQFREQNPRMTLAEFKVIYWWEWTHRSLGRLIGAAFLLPFLWFLWRGWIEPRFHARLWFIFGLGALQGAVGWWMVKSGLVSRVNVVHERLAFHLALACIIYAMILWAAQSFRAQPRVAVEPRVRATAIVLLVLVFCQIFYGALVAGLHAGLIHNDWPLMDGALVPAADRLFFLVPAWSNFLDNVLMVQFAHRIIAYLLWLLAIAHLLDVMRRRPGEPRSDALLGALSVAAAITIQAGIGILTLVNQAPLALALLHQAMAIGVLTIAVVHVARLAAQEKETRVSIPSPSRL